MTRAFICDGCSNFHEGNAPVSLGIDVSVDDGFASRHGDYCSIGCLLENGDLVDCVDAAVRSAVNESSRGDE